MEVRSVNRLMRNMQTGKTIEKGRTERQSNSCNCAPGHIKLNMTVCSQKKERKPVSMFCKCYSAVLGKRAIPANASKLKYQNGHILSSFVRP